MREKRSLKSPQRSSSYSALSPLVAMLRLLFFTPSLQPNTGGATDAQTPTPPEVFHRNVLSAL